MCFKEVPVIFISIKYFVTFGDLEEGDDTAHSPGVKVCLRSGTQAA